jgi:hypothetical protein
VPQQPITHSTQIELASSGESESGPTERPSSVLAATAPLPRSVFGSATLTFALDLLLFETACFGELARGGGGVSEPLIGLA